MTSTVSFITLFFKEPQVIPNLMEEMDSLIISGDSLIATTRVVLQLPVKAFFMSMVRADSRKGTWASFLLKERITRPSVVRDIFIFLASSTGLSIDTTSPACDFLILSEPAKSQNENLEVTSLPPCLFYRVKVTIQWDLELLSFNLWLLAVLVTSITFIRF